MDSTTKNTWLKITKIFCIILGFCSLIIFVPSIRNLIIIFGEKYMGRSLNHWLWNARLIKWEIQFFLTIIIILSMLYLSFFNKIQTFDEKTIKLFSWIIIAVSTVIFIIVAFQSNDYWYDETFSLGLARHNIKELVILTARDVHPPLYYLILKIAMMIFPNSVSAAKIISVIPVILIMSITNLFFAKEFSYKYGILFNLLLLSVYQTFEFAVEIRMYTWCMFFCMLCCLSAFYMIKKGNLRYFLLYVLFAECGAYCQYWTACGLAINFVLVSILCFIKDKKSLKNILITAVIGIAGYLPWAKVVISQVTEVAGEYWIGKVTLLDYIDFILFELPLTGVFKILSIVILIYLIKKSITQFIKKDFMSGFYLTCFLTPILLVTCTTIICIVFKPVFQAKYALPLSYFMLFGIVLSLKDFKLSNNKSAILIGGCLICFVFNASNIYLEEHIHGIDNKKLRKAINDNLTENTVFIFEKDIHKHIPYCLAYSYPENRIYNYDILELWTSAYFYDRSNLINDISDENDLCLVLNEETEPPENFKNIKGIKGNISNYPGFMLYFKK